MSSYEDRWRVIVTGLASDVTAGILCNQFEIASHRITISGRRAVIQGFENEKEAKTFVVDWNRQFQRAHMDMECRFDEDDHDQRRTSHRQERHYDHEEPRRKENIDCRHGSACWNKHSGCPYKHPNSPKARHTSDDDDQHPRVRSTLFVLLEIDFNCCRRFIRHRDLGLNESNNESKNEEQHICLSTHRTLNFVEKFVRRN